MKVKVLTSAALAIVASLALAPNNASAQATCRATCAVVYRTCIDNGWSPPDCGAEKADCLAACESSTIPANSLMKYVTDRNGNPVIYRQKSSPLFVATPNSTRI